MHAHDFIGTNEAQNAAETPTAWTEVGKYSTAGMRIEDQQWTATSNSHVSQSILEPHAWPRDGHGVYDTMSFPSWTMDSSMSNHVPPYSTTALINSHNDLAQTDLWQDVLSLDHNVHSMTSLSSDCSLPAEVDQVEPEWDQEPRLVIDLTGTQDSPNKIGSVLDNGKFMCNYNSCAGRTFARYPELKRHHTTKHAAKKRNFGAKYRNVDAASTAEVKLFTGEIN